MWVYKNVTFDVARPAGSAIVVLTQTEVASSLSRLGEEGWEAYAVSTHLGAVGATQHIYHLKMYDPEL